MRAEITRSKKQEPKKSQKIRKEGNQPSAFRFGLWGGATEKDSSCRL